MATCVCVPAGSIDRVTDDVPGGPGVGPLRVWPGGLAMSRTIGDAGSPQVGGWWLGGWGHYLSMHGPSC